MFRILYDWFEQKGTQLYDKVMRVRRFLILWITILESIFNGR